MNDKCLRVRICRLLLISGLLFLSLLVPPPVSAASKASYYDWGPYYNTQQVLGFTFSSLEQLPVPTIPQDIVPPPASGIMPGSFFYPFETFAENVQLTLTTNPVAREELRLSFAEERLSEAKTLVEQGQPGLAADAAASYRDIMETVSTNVQALATSGVPNADLLVASLEDTAADHAVLAQSLAFTSAPNVASVWGDITTSSEHAMDAVADSANRPTIPDELSTSIQALKEQGLITPEESAKIYGFTSRSEVREELDRLAGAGQFPPAELARLNEAVSVNHPDVYKSTIDSLRFAELRTYQTQPPPSSEIVSQIRSWESQSGDVPPPQEIRPYLYYNRAQELASEINLSQFATEQQAEVVKFYPEAAVSNPTYSPLPEPTPSPSPTPSPEPGSTPSPEATPAPSPQPTAPNLAEPYLAPYSGPLPGTPGFFFKQFGENISLATTFDPGRRIELNMRYAEERLRETNALSQYESLAKLHADAYGRYGDAIEAVSNDIKNFGGPEEDKRDLAEKLELQASRHNVIFEKGLIPPPTDKVEAYKKAAEATENALDKAADSLERPALPPALVDRLQDLKAQGLILPEEATELTSASSREEVRAKVRELVNLGTFPPADAKKLDEGQARLVPQDYNQLVEVRKIEELQGLRAVQAEFAQTATLRATNAGYTQRIDQLLASIDPTQLKPEDLGGRDDLLQTYQGLSATASARPVNSGQFPVGEEATPDPTDTLPSCPIGTVSRQFEGCVWEDTGKKINDYEQYRCSRPNEYWSFAAKSCVIYDQQTGRRDDQKPLCPAGYDWSWESQSCTTSVGRPLPTPRPIGDIPPEEQDRLCPQGATYEAPKGCVWDDNGRSVYDSSQYRCSGQESYYSFEKRECVTVPEGEGYANDAAPSCPKGRIWLWGENRCTEPQTFETSQYIAVDPEDYKPSFVTPDSPFYFIKQAAETVQFATAVTPQRRAEVRINQAKERFGEAYYLLGKKDEEGFKDILGAYTDVMQTIYNDIASTENLSADAKKALGEKLTQVAVEQNTLLQQASTLASTDVATPISAALSVTTQGIDRAADLKGEPAIPEDIKAKIEALSSDMLPDEKKQEILAIDNRLEARLALGSLTGIGALNTFDTLVFDQDLYRVDPAAQVRLAEIKKLDEIADLTTATEDIEEKVTKTEDIATKLDEFQKTFEVGQEVPADLRPYMRLTRIDEVAQTVRPDIVRLEDFGNRKDVQLAVATLQQEFKPTSQDFRRVEEFRRSNPNRALPPELARFEALGFSLGVRDSAGACFLPSPPFAPNTPCPPTGAAIPIYSSTYAYTGGGPGRIVDEFRPGWPGGSTIPPPVDVDKDGKPLVYGKGPEPTKPGACPDGFHWMYDSGGWCMSNSSNYSNIPYSTPPSGPNYTPYTPYYSPPGYPPTSYGYPGTYPSSPYPYTPPNYWGPGPTTYTTNPPPGTVPGTGPAPTSPGQCPSGYHWMSDSGGWCMANGDTYTGPGRGYPGSPVPPSCPSGSYWSSYSNSCVSSGPYPSPNLDRSSCGPGYYWTGSSCIPTTLQDQPTGPKYYTPCNYPPGGCSPGSYWDFGSCSCRNSAPTPSNSCAGISCYGGTYLDYSSCTCKSSYSGPSGPGSPCSPPSGGCGSGWWDSGSCSCKAASPQGCYNVSASSCGSGFYWDSGACTCRSSSTSTYTAPSSGGSSSGSCSSGYHWMSDNGGWCMSDGTSGGSTSTTSSPTPESSPAPSSSPTPESSPAPSSSPAPAESPAPSPSP